MKALILSTYGSPENLQFTEIETPVPKEGEVLVKIKAASINAADFDQIRGSFMIRMGGSLKGRILGSDMSGVVEKTGAGVTTVQPGVAVLADLYDFGFGAFAQYVCVPESALTKKPDSMSFAQAATVLQAGVCALQGLNKIDIRKGDGMLINGAGGGMGSYAIQIAKSRGAKITAVDRADKFDLMRRLGADVCLDYKTTDYTDTGDTYDAILDLHATRKASAHKRALKEGGMFVVVGGKFSSIISTHLAGSRPKKSQGKQMSLLMWKPNDKDDIRQILDMIADGRVVPVIDKVFGFDDALDAFRYFDGGNAKGKVVITFD